MVRKKGFTLIELLVVISIIAMLLAILMPALGIVKKKAKMVVCRAQLKQFSYAVQIYANDYDGKMCSYEYTSGGDLWIAQLHPYLGDMDKARLCPSTRADDTKNSNGQYVNSSTSKYAWWWGSQSGSYGINSYIYTDDYMGGACKQYIESDFDQLNFGTISNVKSASQTPSFVDSRWVDLWPKEADTVPANFLLDGTDSSGQGDKPTRNHIRRSIIDRHGDTVNVTFIDGSARDVKLSEMWSLRWHRSWKPKLDMKREDGTPIYKKTR